MAVIPRCGSPADFRYTMKVCRRKISPTKVRQSWAKYGWFLARRVGCAQSGTATRAVLAASGAESLPESGCADRLVGFRRPKGRATTKGICLRLTRMEAPTAGVCPTSPAGGTGGRAEGCRTTPASASPSANVRCVTQEGCPVQSGSPAGVLAICGRPSQAEAGTGRPSSRRAASGTTKARPPIAAAISRA